MLVLGIDPGTATTGFGFVREEEDGEIVAVHYGVVSTQAGVPMPKRLQKLYVDLTDLIAQYKPDKGPTRERFFGRKSPPPSREAQGPGTPLCRFQNTTR